MSADGHPLYRAWTCAPASTKRRQPPGRATGGAGGAKPLPPASPILGEARGRDQELPMKHRSHRGTGLIPLGFVIQADSKLRVPSSIEASPIAFRDWESAVGTRIAARARPIKLERGVLLVRAESSTWAQELELLSEAIIPQLRGRNLAVDSLRFRVGQVDAPDRPPSREEV